MENQTDKLFKDKLENHTWMPSANAWEKIENNLEKKSKPIIWWRAAAAILLVGALLGISYWWTGKEAGTQPIAEQKKVDSKPETKTEQTQAPEIDATKKSTEIIKKQLQQSIQTPLAKSNPIEITNKKMEVAHVNENSAQYKDNSAAETTLAPMATEQPTATTTAIASTVSQTKEKPIVLEFKLEPVTTEMVVAAKQEKRGIKTILTDLKNGEANINFHTLKENLLAFNSKKPKSTESQQ